MDPRIPFVVFTVAGAVNGTTGGLASAVKAVVWVGLLVLVVADRSWACRQRLAG
jgi:hypothetical protein